MTDSAATLIASQQDTVPRSAVQSRFFAWMAGLLLLTVVIGFSPTYFLKPFFDTPALTLRTQIHGPLFAAWFVLFFVQTALIARRRTTLLGLRTRCGMCTPPIR